MPPRAPRPRPAQRPNAVQPAQVRPKVVVITDPGPDPNDVKALLVLAMAHAHAQIELAAVVANGGAHPARRAQLARLILDRVGESAVPVGVGSAGTFVPEQPHECAMRGFGAVDRARLLDGQALLARTLRRATRSSVTMLLISGLRDFADLVAAQPDLVLRKVRAVTIQAGLVPDAASPYGYAPDTSQNNAFDVQAAAAVFAFCFSRGLRMIVVSRHAVPLLPMQLARSFAERNDSEVLRYLAAAQFLGLAGLWQKLCAGQLPTRCTKQWYFETFCGVSGDEFARRALASLDETADILTHLTGFIKPYDVIAAMTVLPIASDWFSAAAEVVVDGTAHQLLLGAEHAMDVRSVHNLLRETYHSVALLDTDVCGIEDASHAPRLLAGLRAAVARPAVRLGGVGASFSSAAAAAAAAADVWSSSARARPYLATLARSAPVIDLLHADRLRSADGAASHALVTELLGASIVEARVRQTRLAVRIVALTVPVCAGTLALYLSTFVGQDVTRPDLAKLHSHGAARHAQAFLANLGMSMGTILVLLCLHPSAEQRARILAAGALGHAAIVVSTLPYAGMLLRLAPCLASRCAPVDNLADARLALTVAAAAHVTTSACNCARGVAVLWRRRFDPPRLLARLWRSLLVQLANGAVAHFIVFAAIAASGAYTPAAGDGFERVLAGAVAAASIPAYALCALLAASPPLQRRAQALAAQPVGGGAASVVASLAPLIGYGSVEGERDPVELHAEARAALRGIVLDHAGLEALGAAWAAAEAWRDAACAAHGGVHDHLPAAAAAATVTPVAAVTHDGRGDDDDSHSSMNPSTRTRPASLASAGDASRLASATVAAAAVTTPRSVAPAREQARLVAALARAHTVSVDAFDCYVVHDEHDGARAKLAALRAFCEQYEQREGRPPMAFVGTLCAAGAPVPPAVGDKLVAQRSSRGRTRVAPGEQPPASPQACGTASAGFMSFDRKRSEAHGAERQSGSTVRSPALARTSSRTLPDGGRRSDGGATARTSLQALEHLPVRLARSAQLVVLASAALFDGIVPVLEIFVWRLTGGGQDMIRMQPIAADARERSALLAAADAFHVVNTDVGQHSHRKRITRAVETASMAAFNDVVRALFPAVRDELARGGRAGRESCQ